RRIVDAVRWIELYGQFFVHDRLLAKLEVQHRLHRGDHTLGRRQRELFEVRRIGHRHVGARNLGRGRVEVVEGLHGDLRADLRADRAHGPGFFDEDETIGLAHRSQYRFHVERAQRAQIDDLDVDAILGELLGGFQRVDYAARERDHCRVAPDTGDACLADGDEKVIATRHNVRVTVQ